MATTSLVDDRQLTTPPLSPRFLMDQNTGMGSLTCTSKTSVGQVKRAGLETPESLHAMLIFLFL